VVNGSIEITSPAEVRVILGKERKPMAEAIFKTRLVLLEAEYPEFQRQPSGIFSIVFEFLTNPKNSILAFF